VLKNEPHALACDRWDRVGDNLRAIGLHIDAIRGMDRWGVGSIAQAFAGYGVKQLAEMGARKAWWEVLGMKEQPTSSTAVQERFHQLALKHHPDRGRPRQSDGRDQRRLRGGPPGAVDVKSSANDTGPNTRCI
jgi:hypothetical protein